MLTVAGLLLTSLTPPADAPSGRNSPPAVALVAGVGDQDTFVLPVPGAPVFTPFRAPAHRYGAGHRGVDLAGGPGVAVLAAGDGVVAFAGTVAGRPVVSVQHPSGLRTTYEPVLASVAAGADVRAGDVLGTLQDGHPGCSTSCLHWGARLLDGDYLDPMSLLGPRRVRLYPWVDP
ncbi:hypothetical protein GCM10009818_24950 [Nakamurella flavida]